jgi:hypothetical protein
MSSIELEKTEEIAKDLGEAKPKRKYVKKPKVVVPDIVSVAVPDIPANVAPAEPKVKRERTEKQKLAFEKCLESKREKTALRKEEKAQQLSLLSEEKLMKAEDKLVKTGIKLQKKALIQLAIEEGDDIDIPDEIVKKVLKRRASKKQQVAPPVQSHTPPQSPSRKFSFVDN